MADQLNMFGPPEPIENIPPAQRYRDDVAHPCERQLLWPAPHADELGAALLERLYGDLPRRTRCTVPEVCRVLRMGHSHVYNLIEAGALDAIDGRHPQATQNCYMIYRYSIVRLLFNREFVENCTRVNLPTEDLALCLRLADKLRAAKKGAPK